MDGYKIRAKLALNFPRAVASAEADEIMMQYARAFAQAVECELSNGDLPFEERELLDKITDRVQALPKKNVRLIGLHVWHKGAVSSGSMLAVKNEQHTKATVPAMPALTQPPSAPMPSSGPQRNTTPAPRAATSATPSSANPVSARVPPTSEGPESVRSAPAAAVVPTDVAITTRPPAAATRPAPAVSSTTAKVAVPGAPTVALRVPAAAAPAAAPAPAVSAPPAATPSAAAPPSSGNPLAAATVAARSAAPAPQGVRGQTRGMPPVVPATSGAFPATARLSSGVGAAVEPRIVRTKSGFLLALEQSQAASGTDLGRAMAQPVRDAAAALLFSTLDALQASLADPLCLLDGRVTPDLRRALVGEACVCVCYVLFESFTQAGLPQMAATEIVQGACVHALMDSAMPVSEISRYLATESPREEFSSRVCALLDVRETHELGQRLDSALRSLRVDVRSCVEPVGQRLGRSKAAGQRMG